MANEEIASQVLDYWFAIEFLGQPREIHAIFIGDDTLFLF